MQTFREPPFVSHDRYFIDKLAQKIAVLATQP